jgi:glutamate/tyrosine decarboxylase-like PLP-dependent enzyme
MKKSKNLLDTTNLDLLVKAVMKLESGFTVLPEFKSKKIKKEAISVILNEVAERMTNNFPYFHPLYAGQMLKPPHEIARLAYMLAMWINPNNHALDGGKASSKMEKEAVKEIAKMFVWKKYLGHLTGGGTMANLEALWVAGQIHPGKKILASSQAHYTHSRISNVLGLSFESVPCNNNGKMDITKLKEKLDSGKVGTVVVTIGTTAIGAIDPLNAILKLQKKYKFRIHADAAYGGYFILSNTLNSINKISYNKLPEVDSLVIDPHKHGLQPYGCGCILFKDPSVGKFYKHDSPYTYFSSDELHLGEISLECSRPGAAAVALWATMKFLPLKKNGEFAKMLSDGQKAALKLFKWLKSDSRFITGPKPELDIVTWIPKASSISRISELSRLIFNECAKHNLHLALADLPIEFFNFGKEPIRVDKNSVTCLRSVLMKHDHLEWIDKIIAILSGSTDGVI